MSSPENEDDQAGKPEKKGQPRQDPKSDTSKDKRIPPLTPEDVEMIGGRSISTQPTPPPVTGPPITVTGNPPPPPPPPPVTGPPITVTANPPPETGSPPPPPPPPTPPKFKTRGRTNCAPAVSAVQQALNQLYAGSKTAAGFIDTAFSNNVSINIIRIDTQDFGTQDDYNTSTHTIDFDPFSVANVTEGDTSVGYSPLVALGHEIAHAANPSLSDSQIIALQNQIAAELNASYGMNNNTTRPTSDEGYGSYTNTDAVDSTAFSVQRGDNSCG